MKMRAGVRVFMFDKLMEWDRGFISMIPEGFIFGINLMLIEE